MYMLFMRQTASASLVLGCWLLLLPTVAFAQAAQRTPVATTPYFAFYSDFETNLNDALVTAGIARKNAKPELFHAGDEVPCFEKLPPSARAGWDLAVDFYAKIVSPAEWNARQQFLIRMELVGFLAEDRSAGAADYLAIARGFRTTAAPAYRACRWTVQDAANRRWIEEMRPRLAADEQHVATRLQQLYKKEWPTLPVLVDVVETVNWAGANTSWSDAGQGNVLIARDPGGASGFEVLFHEASHVLMDPAFPVRQALDQAAKAAGFRLPGDLWHVVLFYQTGEAVRRILDARGPTGYKPALSEIYERGTWTQYRDAIEKHWRPYLDGKRSLDQAAAALIAQLAHAEKR